MGKRTFSILLALALVAGVFSALPATAQEAPAVPAEPNVTDPIGDANYVNDQGLNSVIGRDGDHAGPADASTSADIMAGWFTNDAASVTAHILVEGTLPSNPSYFLRMQVDPAGGEDDCLWFQAGIPGVVDPATAGQASPDPIGNLRNLCGDGSIVAGEVSLAANPAGGTIVSIKIPMGTHGLAVGMTFGSPNIGVRNWPRTPAASATAPQVDNTKPGLPYTITAGGPVVAPAPEEPAEEPPGKSDPPGKGKKKGCKKGKGKKKGACPGEPKPPVVAACPAYVAGEEGAEAETSVVTDAATEEKPVVVELDAGLGLGSAGPYNETTSLFQNIQVDTASADRGLYVKFEFPNMHDYDLYLNYADGSTAANSGDFNAAAGHDLGSGSPDGAWEAGTNFESVLGIRTADCAGYTARMVSWLTNGGGVTLSMWLGDVVADPAAPSGGGDEEALSTFYSLLGI